MKTAFLLATIVAAFAISSEMSYQDELLAQKHRRQMYETCISTSSQYVITDAEINRMIDICSARSNYVTEETP